MRELHIYIDRLKNGRIEKISETISSDFLEIDEKDLVFDKTLKLEVEAYLADDHLIVRFSVQAQASIPCSICNAMTKNLLKLDNACFSIALSETKRNIFDFTDELRATILNAVPHFSECNQSNCPERSNIKKYLKSSSKDRNNTRKEVYFPFGEDNFFIEL